MKNNSMVKEWNNEFIIEFENGYKVVLPFIKGLTRAVPTKSKINVIGPNGEYLTTNFLKENHGRGLSGDDIVTILATVKSLEKNQNLDIL